MLKRIRNKLPFLGTQQAKREAVKTADSASAGEASQKEDHFEKTPEPESKASPWDTMSGFQKVGASTLGAWLGFAVVGGLLVATTPISGPAAIAIGAAAGATATQLKLRLSKTDQTKSQAALEKKEMLEKPMIWDDTNKAEKAQVLGGFAVGGALILGSLVAAASTLAAPVAFGIGAAMGVASGFGLMKTARKSDVEGWDVPSERDPHGELGLTTEGELMYGLGGGHYMSADGTRAIDYGGVLRGLDGKPKGRLF